MMKKLLTTISILLLSSAVYSAEPTGGFFDSHFNDYTDNLDEAKSDSKKGVFVFFHSEDCPYCQKMERYVLNQPEVIKFFKDNFKNYKLGTDSDLEMVDFDGKDTIEMVFAKRHNLVGATPVLAFFDLEGKRAVRRTGFVDKDEFLLLAKYYLEGAYKTEKFIKYKRKQKS